MRTVRTPEALHDVLGERFVPAQLAVVLLFATAVASLLIARLDTASALPPWRLTLAWILVADIAAGCLANFTRSTNDFYATRPRNRWVFIGVHVHVLVVAWLVEAPLGPAALVWAYTVAAASIVNLSGGRDTGRFVAATALAGAVVLIPFVVDTPALAAIHALFTMKVAYGFAVDHTRDGRRAGDAWSGPPQDSTRATGDAPTVDDPAGPPPEGARAEPVTIRSGLAPLERGDLRTASRLIADSFRDDPLFVRVAADDPSTREALARYLLAMVRLVGGSAHGWFAGGQLVGVMLLDRRGRPNGPGTLAAALRFVPLAVRIGLARTRWLNRYFVVTSTGGPAGPHRYLTLLAVARHAQGAGIGRAMINAAWQDTVASPDAVALALDTENEANVRLYERLGFALTSRTALDGTPVFMMERRRGGAGAVRDSAVRDSDGHRETVTPQ